MVAGSSISKVRPEANAAEPGEADSPMRYAIRQVSYGVIVAQSTVGTDRWGSAACWWLAVVPACKGVLGGQFASPCPKSANAAVSASSSPVLASATANWTS